MPQSRNRKIKEGLRKRKDSRYWWASWTDEAGRRHFRSTKTSDKRQAMTLLHTWRGSGGPAKAARYTLQEVAKMFIVDSAQRGYSASTIADRTATVYRYISPDSLMPLSRAAIRKYITDRLADGARPATVNSELGTLSRFHNWAAAELETGWKNPCQGQVIRNVEPRTRWLTRAEYSAVLEGARGSIVADWLPDLIIFLLNTGARVSEVLGMRWHNVQIGQGLVVLDQQKNRRLGSLVLNKTARQVLARRPRDGEYVWPCRDRIQVWRYFKRAAERAGVNDVTIHDLRRTCGSWMLQAGVSIAQVSKVLRHQNIAVTSKVYAHLAPEQVLDAVEMLADSDVSVTFSDLKIVNN